MSVTCLLYIIIGVGGTCAYAQKGKFLVVLDAGHGGGDSGCVGSKPTNREKDIVLDVVLKVGRLLKNNCPDIKTVYTRDDDFFVPLKERANIANKAKADLFVSVHVNSVENRATNHPMGRRHIRSHSVRRQRTWKLRNERTLSSSSRQTAGRNTALPTTTLRRATSCSN